MLGLVLAVCIKALWRQLSQLPQASEPWPGHSKLGVTFTLGHSGDTEGHVYQKRGDRPLVTDSSTGHWKSRGRKDFLEEATPSVGFGRMD